MERRSIKTCLYYEPGLTEKVDKVRLRNVNLFFSTDVNKAIEDSEMIFMAVNTPTKDFRRLERAMAADLQ